MNTTARDATEDRPSLLIVDDDERLRERMARAFRERGYEIREAISGDEALKHAEHDSPEWALVDLRMPGEWGLHVVKGLLAIDPSTRVVVLTAYGSIATALEAMRIGAINFLQKPASVDEIERAFLMQDAPNSSHPPAPNQVPSLAKAEWEHINRVLTECDGNIRQASKLLGLHRRTLQRKLAKFPVAR